MTDPHNLARFLEAQAPLIEQVQTELRAGQKRTHWMWFIFPQLRGLGTSPTAQHYGIASREEAIAYATHPTLGPRLRTCIALVNQARTRTIHQIFGSPDDLKFHSCTTLFAACAPETPEFHQALAQHFANNPDPRTTHLLGHPDA